MEDYFREIKLRVASLMMDVKRSWENTYKDREPDDFEKKVHEVFANEKEEEIQRTIPHSQKLTICISGCAKGELSHYDIEDSLQAQFKAGEGIQYDSEGGQFWVYIKPSLVQRVLRHIDYNFPGQIDLNVSPNSYASNPWFQNWSQAEKYITVEMEIGF